MQIPLPQNLNNLVLGNTHESNAENARHQLPVMTEQVKKLLDLQSVLSDAGCPRTTFDKVVEIIEDGVITNAFSRYTPIPRLKTLLSKLSDMYPLIEPEEICVQLETAARKKGDNRVRSGQFDKAYIYRWDAKAILKNVGRYSLDGRHGEFGRES